MANRLLYPRNSATRRILDMDGMWNFKFDYENKGDASNWKNGLNDTTTIPVPASFNDFFVDKDSREYAGNIWYETKLYVPSEWSEMDLDIRFDCATHFATVYVNGVEVTKHKGGFLPFNANINRVVKFDEENTVVVKINNELSRETLPVGQTITLENGKRMVKPYFDFFNYAGLQRSVRLVATPKESVVDYTVNHILEGNDARIEYKVETTGETQVYVSLYDEDSILVASAEGKEGSLLVKSANLWNVLDAYLYTIKMEIKDNDKVIDEYKEEVGIRTVEVKGTKIYINNKAVYLKGFGKHEDSDVVGRGFNIGMMKRDFELMKWIGANSFRTSHYPYSEEIYQMADREGFIIFDETPAVGLFESLMNFLDASKGANTNFFDNVEVHKETKEHHLQVIRDLIERDKNHASVCVWSLLNEPDSTTDSAVSYFEDLFDLAHELDVQKRPRTFANIMMAPAGVCKCSHLCDIISLNRYYGWYTMGGYEMSNAEVGFMKEVEAWGNYSKPVVFTEYGADTYAGEHKLPSVQWSEEYQVEYLEMQHRVFDSFDFVVGEQVWNFADFQTTEGIMRVNGNKKGIFTRNRQPKLAAYTLKKRWESLPLNYKN
ncbi:MAG: beta-glucuronidase [Clostridiales bacterium]|nr:beta-glucuronidase [Clostridiales bacterium]